MRLTAANRAREALWEQFKESTTAPGGASIAATPRLVKIEKRYRFAGEEVRYVGYLAAAVVVHESCMHASLTFTGR